MNPANITLSADSLFIWGNAGWEDALGREASSVMIDPSDKGRGWIVASGRASDGAMEQLCFAHGILKLPQIIVHASAYQIAIQLVDFFCQAVKTITLDAPWPLLVRSLDSVGRSPGAKAVESAFLTLLRKRMSRVARLAQCMAEPPVGLHEGLFVILLNESTVVFSRTCIGGGQRRMRDDPDAPSRSFLKVEEAYGILGCHPMEGERVADLGAAPGGWSYSAAKRGALVKAVDNGPLKAGARNHPLIEPVRADAFTFQPAHRENFDWLFCDMVEDPYRIVGILDRWIEKQWCNSFIVNLKFGHTDPIRLIQRVYDSPWMAASSNFTVRLRHLFHDREEFTIIGRHC